MGESEGVHDLLALGAFARTGAAEDEYDVGLGGGHLGVILVDTR